jgi:hypothetical protein
MIAGIRRRAQRGTAVTVVGRITVLEPLGRTATGESFVGRDPDLDRVVVLKRLSQLVIGDAEALHRFRAQAQLMARVQSPYCVRVFDYVEAAGEAWIVSEYVEGTTLGRLLARDGKPTAAQALHAVRGALAGLADIHRAGLVHRDVRPETIVITRDGTSKLADAAQMTLAGAWAEPPSETPATMSPELVRGGTGDARSDIYSVGCVLHECFEGRPPFVGDSATSVLQQHVEVAPPPAGHAPPCLQEIIAAALAKDPAQRPQTVEEVAARLDECAARSLGPDWWERGALAGLLGVAGVVATAAVVPGIASRPAAPTPAVTPASVTTGPRRARIPGGPAAVAAGVVAVAAAGIAGVLLTRSGGAPGPTAATTTAPPATTAVASASLPPAPSLAPVAAVFDQATFTTTYTVSVAPTDGLTYSWSVTIPDDPGCAAGFKGGSPAPNQATWFHKDSSQGGPCSHGPGAAGPRGHNGVVSVIVSRGRWTCNATFQGTEGANGQSTASGDPPGSCLAK